MNHIDVPKMSMNMDEMPLDHFAFQQIGMSNTEVSTGSDCERAWLFGFHPETKLKQLTQGVALTRGIVGHMVLERFYRGLMEEESYDDAANAALGVMQVEQNKALLLGDGDKLDMLKYLRRLIEAYLVHYKDDIKHWEILDVEAFHALTWEGEETLYLPIRLDMTIYQRGGKFKGETSPVDHKFTNDFWNQYKIRLNSQLPLQIRAVRNSQYKGKSKPVVNRAIINMIRTRQVKDVHPLATFRRAFPEPNKRTMDKIFASHLRKAKRLEQLKRVRFEEAYSESSDAWGSHNCEFCFFKSICSTDLEGGNVQQVAELEYERSTYGYPTMEELYNERG